jgi:hypothetical protein
LILGDRVECRAGDKMKVGEFVEYEDKCKPTKDLDQRDGEKERRGRQRREADGMAPLSWVY